MHELSAAGGHRVLILHARHLVDAEQVIEAVRDHQAVVLNTGGAEEALAQRLIDFACGGMEAIDGQAHRLSEEAFLFCPGYVAVEP